MFLLMKMGFLLFAAFACVICFCVFFDQAVFMRKGTTYRCHLRGKKVAITFDDGPSPLWTPLILDELKKYGAKATFFMIGHHVQKYPEIAKRVADEGHQIGNHGYAHSVILYYTLAEIEEEIKYTEHVIRHVTGQTTHIYRPPKSWMTSSIKKKILNMGYGIVLWSLNSKDWVGFPHVRVVDHLIKHLKSGDIILFHDSGNVFSREGGDRKQTLLSVSLLLERLTREGYEFVTVDALLSAATKEV